MPKHNSQNRSLSYGNPPSKFKDDPIGTRTSIEEALVHVVPVFCVQSPNATPAMIAAVMRVTRTYARANNDDVAKVLFDSGTPYEPRNGKIYFDLKAYKNRKTKVVVRAGVEG